MRFFFPVLTVLLSTISVHGVITADSIKENAANGLRLLSLQEGAEPVWKSEEEKLDLIRAHIKFFDITEDYDPNAPVSSPTESFAPAVTYAPPSHQTAIKSILGNVSLSNMQNHLTSLTSFNNRYYKSQTGADATSWIVKTVSDIAAMYPASKATVKPFNHTWVQGSIIAHIPGTTTGPVTIVGAHMDSINQGNPTTGRAPGADDDGSGSVNLIEAFRTLLAAGFRPTTPVEFHWYSGEEGGLLGSQAISKSYKTAGTQVKAMMQLDMTAYSKPGLTEVIALVPDFVDSGLTTFVGSVIDTYSTIPSIVGPPCGYACSDHASWFKQGYPSSFPFEAPYGDHNPLIHTSSDTTSVNGFSWSHSLEYAKVAVAFAYELGI